MSTNQPAPGRQLEAIGNMFSSAPAVTPQAKAPMPDPASPTPKAEPRRARTNPPRSSAPSTKTAGSRVYASLPADEVHAVRALAKARSWSLLAVAAAALEEYSPELYAKEPTLAVSSPLPGAKANKRHGDTYLPLNIYNAEQAQWLETALQPYGEAVKSHLLGCALSHYLTTQP